MEGIDIWSAKQWSHVFLHRLDLINWGLPRKLIIDRDPKFFSKFWTALFAKIKIKLLYSIAYQPQTDGANEQTNQTIEIALQFFVYAMEDLSQ